MSLRKNIVMALILIVGLVYVLRDQQAQFTEKKSQQAQEEKKRIFPGVTPAQIQSVEVKSGTEAYEIANRSAVGSATPIWEISNATLKNVATDGAIASGVLTALANLRSLGSISGTELEPDRAIYGLAQPELTLKVRTANEEQTLRFGKQNAVTSRRYMERAGEDSVYLLEGAIFTALNKKFEELRNHRPIAFDPKNVTEISVSSPAGNSRKLIRSQAGEWDYSDAVMNFRADSETIARLLGSLSQIRATAFVDPNTPEPPVLQPDATISLVFGEKGETIAFEVGGTAKKVAPDQTKQSGFYLKRTDDPTVYEFERRVYGDLLRSPVNLRNKLLLESLETGAVTRIHFVIRNSDTEPQREFTLERSPESKWNVREGSDIMPGEPKKANTRKILDWLNQLTKLRAVSLIDPEEGTHSNLGLSNPRFEARVDSGKSSGSFVVGNPVGELTEGPEPETNPPRYAAVQGLAIQDADSPLVSFILSQIDWNALHRDASYFLDEPTTP